MLKSFHPRARRTLANGLFVGIAGLCAAHAARAADPMTEAMQQAYAPYRAALFRTNGGSAAEALAALGEARQAWQAVVRRYGEQAPSPYDRDGSRAQSLAAVDGLYEHAARQIEAGRLPEAHETLEGVREQLAELRHRNGVVSYSDAMNAYHAQMEKVLKEAPAQLAAPEARLNLVAQTGVLAYLARRLDSEAPDSLRQAPEFKGLLKAVGDSVERLQSALHAGQAEAAKEALKGLKKPYSQLFLKFG